MEQLEKTMKVKEWIEKTGYPFEIQLTKMLRKQGFSADISVPYRDINSNILREIDIVAEYLIDLEGSLGIAINLIIECKKSEKPFVIFASEEEYSSCSEINLKNYNANHKCASLFLAGEASKLLKEVKQNISLGHTIVEAFKTSDQYIYSGIMGLTNAFLYYQKEFEQLATIENGLICVNIPILAVNSDIYLSSINEMGDTEIKNIQIGGIKTHNPDANFFDENTWIIVTDAQALEGIAIELKTWLTKIAELPNMFEKLKKYLEK